MIVTQLKKWFNQPPPGYQPGHALLCALSDLRKAFIPKFVEMSGAVFTNSDGGVVLNVRERVERHFQMHIVSLEMRLSVASAVEPGICIDIRNTGLLFRTGIVCSVTPKHREAVKVLTKRIMEDSELSRALMLLDFRRCCLESTDHGWSLMIEPYGASEVVNRMPSFRRYIRMEKRQVCSLEETFRSFQMILSSPISV
jgi:hypothetical protein